jgi:glucokinase
MMNSVLMTDVAAANGFLVGVDIGGTKVAAGVVNAAGEIKTRSRKPMVARGAATAGLAAVTSAIDALTAVPGNGIGTLRGIGICSPGPLDPTTGIVINPPNLPCWRNFPLAAEIAKIYRVPVRVDNDGNAAALAETLWGAGRGYKNVFYTCIGTGIGTGIVLDGHIYHGRTGAAAEGGHCSIDYRGPLCTCGKHGCIEVYASGPAIAKRARAKVIAESGPGSALLDLAGGSPDAITSDMVGQAYTAGDRVAKAVLSDTIELLTLWLGNMIDLLDPEVLIMGGGVSTMLRPLFSEIRDRLPSCCVNSRCQEIPLIPACYGEDAGIAGGAALSSLL